MLNFLLEQARRGNISFHMPGHKGSALYIDNGFSDFLNQIMDCDITEILGADNLFQAEGVIERLQDRYAKLYGAARSRLLINGSSAGILAAVLAAVPRKRKLIMARNCHKSVFNALTLGDITPVYAYPDVLPGYDIAGAVSVREIERLLAKHEDADAVVLPSPNYYGICSDIPAIAKAVHERGKILIVDQAHGAHLKFFEDAVSGFPLSAESSGADISINSTHKTLASFTQSAILNYSGNRVDPRLLDDKLQCVQSTSPSYLLLASLDINEQLLSASGAELCRRWAKILERFYLAASGIQGLKYLPPMGGFDHTKINLSFSQIGIDGDLLKKILEKEYGIVAELSSGEYVMLMTGIGNRPGDIETLLAALSEISRDPRSTGKEKTAVPMLQGQKSESGMISIPEKFRRVPLSAAAGCVCARSLIPYPPGIPAVCPGEIITAEMSAYIAALRKNGDKVIGVDADGTVFVGDDHSIV
jgi:lysine decarboxylase